jgi:hypothetical protein
MKFLPRFLLALVLACSFGACAFKEPIFSEGFLKVDASLGGVWVTEETAGDPRKMEFAVCAPIDDGRYVIHYPAGEKGGIYYEGRLLTVRDRTLMQLRMLASLKDGLPKADAERYTLAWIEKDPAGHSLRLRTLGGDDLKGKGPAEVRELLEKPSGDWGKLFGDPVVFRHLKDE